MKIKTGPMSNLARKQIRTNENPAVAFMRKTNNQPPFKCLICLMFTTTFKKKVSNSSAEQQVHQKFNSELQVNKFCSSGFLYQVFPSVNMSDIAYSREEPSASGEMGSQRHPDASTVLNPSRKPSVWCASLNHSSSLCNS